MTKKKALIIAAILIAIVLAFVGGQAYAKYITELKGEGVAEIATWSFKVNGGTEEIQSIDLTSTYDDNNLAGHKIAPGTTGSFDIVVDGTDADVGIRYNISFEETSEKPTNLKFIYDGKTYNSLTEIENDISGIIGAKDKDKTKTLTINWIWSYETGSNPTEIKQNDIIDTQEAQKITTYTFDVSVTGTQVEP